MNLDYQGKLGCRNFEGLSPNEINALGKQQMQSATRKILGTGCLKVKTFPKVYDGQLKVHVGITAKSKKYFAF